MNAVDTAQKYIIFSMGQPTEKTVKNIIAWWGYVIIITEDSRVFTTVTRS